MVRTKIVADILELIISRIIPEPPPYPNPRGKKTVSHSDCKHYGTFLSRDDIIKHALEEAHKDRGGGSKIKQTLNSDITKLRLNRRPKLPAIIRTTDDPDIRELIAQGRSKGYSEEAISQTRRESERRRLLIPNKEEADTVDLWRLEQRYRQSITRLKGYTQ